MQAKVIKSEPFLKGDQFRVKVNVNMDGQERSVYANFDPFIDYALSLRAGDVIEVSQHNEFLRFNMPDGFKAPEWIAPMRNKMIDDLKNAPAAIPAVEVPKPDTFGTGGGKVKIKRDKLKDYIRGFYADHFQLFNIGLEVARTEGVIPKDVQLMVTSESLSSLTTSLRLHLEKNCELTDD